MGRVCVCVCKSKLLISQ